MSPAHPLRRSDGADEMTPQRIPTLRWATSKTTPGVGVWSNYPKA
jgi:hypothetical protein